MTPEVLAVILPSFLIVAFALSCSWRADEIRERNRKRVRGGLIGGTARHPTLSRLP